MERRTIDVDSITNSENGVNFEIPLSNDFAVGLQQNDSLNNSYLDEVKENSINKVVNYEKYLFYPAYLTTTLKFTGGYFIDNKGVLRLGYQPKIDDLDDYVRDVNKITFHLYLKHREHDSNNDYGSWNSSDEYYWNRWDGETESDGKKKTSNKLSTKKNGDLLGCLGFNDEDVLYQKNALKKSFLRISIYDSPYRQTQKLLYYATLFFDTNELYNKYNYLANTYTIKDGQQRVYQIEDRTTMPITHDDEKLTATFTCTSKDDTSACSDGFYLYLFNTIVDSNKATQLYMKVEFNNAKYGKTVVLTNPRVRKGTDITLNDQLTLDYNNGNNDFPTDYEVTSGSGDNSYVDIAKLYDDLYIPIFVRYNSKKNRYEWYIASNEQCGLSLKTNPDEEPGNINIYLFEPRINKLKP